MPSPSTIRYKYVVTEENDRVVEEEPQLRSLDLFKDMVDAGTVYLNDTWQVRERATCLLRTQYSDISLRMPCLAACDGSPCH